MVQVFSPGQEASRRHSYQGLRIGISVRSHGRSGHLHHPGHPVGSCLDSVRRDAQGLCCKPGPHPNRISIQNWRPHYHTRKREDVGDPHQPALRARILNALAGGDPFWARASCPQITALVNAL